MDRARDSSPGTGVGPFTLAELARAVNAWCETAQVSPVNGQVGVSLTERNIRFYRTLGLVDAPASGDGRGYTEKHLLQLTAIRLLQGQGLPLRRIRELLYGRSLAELREIRRHGQREGFRARRTTPSPLLQPGQSWQLLPLAPDVAILLAADRKLSLETLQKLKTVLEENA